MKQERVGLVIPIYHNNELHADFTRQTIESITSKNHKLFILLILNHSLPKFHPSREAYKVHKSIQNLEIGKNPKGNHVGAAWNLGIIKMLEDGCDFVIVANNDILFHPSAIDNLVAFAQKNPEFILWTASEFVDRRLFNSLKEKDLENVFHEHPHFSYFMVSKRTVDLLEKAERGSREPFPGYFDENFNPGYFEDQDFVHRIYRAGYKAAKTETAKFYHYGSRTIKCDDELNKKNKGTYERGRRYFKLKWNYDPHRYCPQKEEDRLKLSYNKPFGEKETKNVKTKS